MSADRPFIPLNIAVLTVSDTRTEEDDTSGKTLAERVEKACPDVAIETLAYHYSLKAPRALAPRHNVIMRVCSIACCFAHPLAEQCRPANASFVGTLSDWRRLTDRIYVWNYNINFNSPFQM